MECTNNFACLLTNSLSDQEWMFGIGISQDGNYDKVELAKPVIRLTSVLSNLASGEWI